MGTTLYALGRQNYTQFSNKVYACGAHVQAKVDNAGGKGDMLVDGDRLDVGDNSKGVVGSEDPLVRSEVGRHRESDGRSG